jgi:hypothetical protein
MVDPALAELGSALNELQLGRIVDLRSQRPGARTVDGYQVRAARSTVSGIAIHLYRARKRPHTSRGWSP